MKSHIPIVIVECSNIKRTIISKCRRSFRARKWLFPASAFGNRIREIDWPILRFVRVLGSCLWCQVSYGTKSYIWRRRCDFPFLLQFQPF